MAGESDQNANSGEGQNSEGQSQENNDQSGEQKTWQPPKSQAELNKMIQDRVHRERDKYPDYDALKQKASKFDELDQANKSELEKERERATAAETKAQEAILRAQGLTVRAAVIAEATKQKAVNPELIVKLLDKDTLTIDDDGNVSGVTEAITALLAENTFLKGSGFNGSSDGGQRTGTHAVHKRSEIAKPQYWADHRADILAAQSEPGRPRITDD